MVAIKMPSLVQNPFALPHCPPADSGNLHWPLLISPSVSLTRWSFFSETWLNRDTETSYPECKKEKIQDTQVSMSSNPPISTSQRYAGPFRLNANRVPRLMEKLHQHFLTWIWLMITFCSCEVIVLNAVDNQSILEKEVNQIKYLVSL